MRDEEDCRTIRDYLADSGAALGLEGGVTDGEDLVEDQDFREAAVAIEKARRIVMPEE